MSWSQPQQSWSCHTQLNPLLNQVMLALAPAPCPPPCTQVGRQHELKLATAWLEP